MGQMEFMLDENGKPRLLCIDKGGQKVNVGSKLSDFNIVRNLGEGHFGSVKLVTSKLTNKLYAMKEIKASRYNSEEERKQVQKEIKLLENLNHPNVITYFNSFTENGNFYIVIEYINGGSLEDLLIENIKAKRAISERSVWDLLVQCLSGLSYLHNTRKIIHRDIKPDNILLDSEGHLKISDFGVSAINSEAAEELVKCHGTVAGPIQFMSPEMALGENYGFKSDIYMLGLTFFFLMSNQLPEKKISFGPLIIPVKNPDAKLPTFYSKELRDFVEGLLKPPDSRPSSAEAYDEAFAFYAIKYLKTTSITSTLNCILSIKELNKYFQGQSIQKRLLEDETNNTDKYLVTKTFKEALYKVSPSSFHIENVRLECLKLRLFLYADKERVEQSSEIELYNFVGRLFEMLHKELNRFQGTPKKLETVDETNENQVINSFVVKFTSEYISKISEQFYYLTKLVDQCTQCNGVVKYMCGINSLCAMYPDKTAKHFKKKNINIIDMFRHYNKTRLFTEADEFCKHCNKKVTQVNRTKIFYTSPLNYILEISYDDESMFNLTIDENINISEFVCRKDISKMNYTLVGAIYIEQNQNEEMKYVSISRTSQGWVYYNGITLKNCTLNDLKSKKHLKMLFYTSNNS